MAAQEKKEFNKTDMERIGIFQEMGYISINDKYKSGFQSNFNQAAGKGRQMLPGGSKERSALQHGYFTDKFVRVFEAEAYSDPIRLRRQARLKSLQKNIGKPFLPSNGDKKPSGLGNHYGTLAGPVPAFSPNMRPRKAYKVPGKNFYTNPGKKGTGFGYLQVTIGQYQKHAADEYDRCKEITKKENDMHRKALKAGAFRSHNAPRTFFDENPFRSDRPLPPVKSSGSSRQDLKPFKPSSPAKHPAGMHAGTFDTYPSHSVDVYNPKMSRGPVHVVNKSGKTFVPNQGPKSAPVTSIVDQNVFKAINKTNYRQVTSVVY